MSAPVANPVKTCLGCGQNDDHPKHVVTLPDHSETTWHNDCHSRANPSCEICTHVVAHSDGRQGDELRAHIVGYNIPTLDHPIHGLLFAKPSEIAARAAAQMGGE